MTRVATSLQANDLATSLAQQLINLYKTGIYSNIYDLHTDDLSLEIQVTKTTTSTYSYY